MIFASDLSQATAPYSAGSDSCASTSESKERPACSTSLQEYAIRRQSTRPRPPGKPSRMACRTPIGPTSTIVSIIICAQWATKRCPMRSKTCSVRILSMARTQSHGWLLQTNHLINLHSPALSGVMWWRIWAWKTQSTSMSEIYTKEFR